MKNFAVVQVGFATLILVAGAIAGPSTQRTRITFNGPVRVPGAVLGPGTYYFSTPLPHTRTLVRVDDENHKLVTQFMGISDYTQRSQHTVILFGDHECGPKAIKSWFYPGRNIGIRFVYPENEAVLIAAACNEPVPETHDNPVDASQLEGSTVYLMTPQKQEEAYKPGALSASDQGDQEGFNADPR